MGYNKLSIGLNLKKKEDIMYRIDDEEHDPDERAYRAAHFFNLGLRWST